MVITPLKDTTQMLIPTILTKTVFVMTKLNIPTAFKVFPEGCFFGVLASGGACILRRKHLGKIN